MRRKCRSLILGSTPPCEAAWPKLAHLSRDNNLGARIVDNFVHIWNALRKWIPTN